MKLIYAFTIHVHIGHQAFTFSMNQPHPPFHTAMCMVLWLFSSMKPCASIKLGAKYIYKGTQYDQVYNQIYWYTFGLPV